MTTLERPATRTQAAAPPSSRARLQAELALAARYAIAAQPLDQYVALNPLSGLEDQPFERALADAGELLGVRPTLAEADYRACLASGRITMAQLRTAVRERVGEAADAPLDGPGAWTVLDAVVDDLVHGPLPAPRPAAAARTLAQQLAPQLAAQIDRRTARWCAAFADDGQAGWPLPARELGLYGAWHALGCDEPGLPRRLRRTLSQAPADAVDAALAALDALGVPPAEWRSYCEAQLAALPGWTAHLRWREEHGAGALLTDLLALRLVQEWALLEPGAWSHAVDRSRPARAGDAERSERAAALLARRPQLTLALEQAQAALALLPEHDRGFAWLAAHEMGYREQLLAALDQPAAAQQTRRPAAVPQAQVVCCIDPRSEGLRRQLEQLGDYQTFGFAGFFGLALEVQGFGDHRRQAHCPVLIDPQLPAAEAAAAGHEGAAARRLAGEAAGERARSAGHAAKLDTLAPFALAEAGGLAVGAWAALRTFASRPLASARRRAAELALPPVPTQLQLPDAFDAAARADFAEGVLRAIGLVDGFAPSVIFCGHVSHTANNPYAASLACGACGGRGGAPNARAAAQVFNDPQVRELLRGRGIDIPQATWFAAAEHETVADGIAILDVHDVPAEHREALRRVTADLERAAAGLRAERAPGLPGAARAGDRGSDWAQVFPEWGLAGNAALIVGRRALTQHVDLERRAFLHSYDAAQDPSGVALEQILTAPLVVAHGINAQYYFSAVEPEVLGAGTKTVHNVVGGVGALSGPGGDLRIGLPWQSIADGQELRHEPLRLLVLVEAPIALVAEIAARQPRLRHLLDGGWVTLLARAPGERAWQRWQRPEHAAAGGQAR